MKTSGPEPEVIEAIKKGKMKGIDKVFNDDESPTSKEDTESDDKPKSKSKKSKSSKSDD